MFFFVFPLRFAGFLEFGSRVFVFYTFLVSLYRQIYVFSDVEF